MAKFFTCVLLATWVVPVWASDPPEVSISERIDLIELNHYYDEEGKQVFDQLIFYEWSSTQSRFNVIAWRLVKNPNQIPSRNLANGDYVAAWHDGELLRVVHADEMNETWTQYDPELTERSYLPKEHRPDLARNYDRRSSKR